MHARAASGGGIGCATIWPPFQRSDPPRMTTHQAPEIFQIPLDDLDPAGLPPRGTPEFEQAVIGRYALDYAARGWQAVVTLDDAFVRVVAVP